jgi:hypothetical protein
MSEISKPPVLVIPNRVLENKGAEKGVLTTYKMEEVKARLAEIGRMQNPVDHERLLSELRVEFTQGRMRAGWDPDRDSVKTRYICTSTGASQLASEVLPGYFFRGLKELIGLDAEGSDLASKVWTKFASRQRHTERLVRTIRMKVDGEIYTAIRSCHSKGYATYSNEEFVADLMGNSGVYSHMPVLGWTLMDDGIRIRFACLHEGTASFMHLDPDVLLTEPIPMIEVWNSEVGRRKVVMRAGMWRLASTVGIGHWSQNTEYAWVHRGKSERIAARVGAAIEDLHKTANEVCDAYRAAREIEIDHPYTWMEKMIKNLVSETVLSRARAALENPAVPQGKTLAAVVDAIAMAAHKESDIYDQYEIERVASTCLDKGRNEAKDGKITTFVGKQDGVAA